MPSLCGKKAEKLRTIGRIYVGQLSTYNKSRQNAPTRNGAKSQESHRLFTQHSTQFSPRKIGILPLTEHLFYPVSTAPINYYNQLKIKER